MKPMMKIYTNPAKFSGKPKPIKMKYGVSMLPQNGGNGPAPYLDTPWMDKMKELYNLSYISGAAGSIVIYTNYISPPGVSIGFNGNHQDCIDRHVDFNTVVSGRLAKPFSYGCFESDIQVAGQLGKAYLPGINCSTPILDGRRTTPPAPYNFNRLHSQVDYILSLAATKGVKIIGIKWNEESQGKGNADVFPTIQSLVDVTAEGARYVHGKNSSIINITDAQITDDPNCRFINMNATMGTIPFASCHRNYFQVQKQMNDWTDIITRVREFHSVTDKFRQQFPGGQEELAQQQFGDIDGMDVSLNIYSGKVGQGIVMSSILLRAIMETATDDVIAFFTHSQSNGLMSGTGRNFSVKPCFYMIKALQGALVNDGLIDVQLQSIEGAENLVYAGVQRGSVSEIYFVNEGKPGVDRDIVIPTVQVNDHHKSVAVVDGWGGDLASDTATQYTQPTGDSITIKAGYCIKVVTQ